MQLLFGENIPTCLLALGIKIFTFRGKSVIIFKISFLAFYKNEKQIYFGYIKGLRCFNARKDTLKRKKRGYYEKR